MKRYLLFYGSTYYPKGGMEDYVGQYNSPEDALEAFKLHHEQEKRYYAWYQIYDTVLMQGAIQYL